MPGYQIWRRYIASISYKERPGLGLPLRDLVDLIRARTWGSFPFLYYDG